MTISPVEGSVNQSQSCRECLGTDRVVPPLSLDASWTCPLSTRRPRDRDWPKLASTVVAHSPKVSSPETLTTYCLPETPRASTTQLLTRFVVGMSEHSGDGKRSRSDDVDEPTAKRLRESASQEVVGTSLANLPADAAPPFSRLGLKPQAPALPKSLEVATGVKADLSSRKGFVGEPEVGIIAYLGDSSYTGIQGVIKQRYSCICTVC